VNGELKVAVVYYAWPRCTIMGIVHGSMFYRRR
jgi:hypothetical protein